MLVLSRRPGEKILFPGLGITVEIVQTKGNTVRVGVSAPEDIRVLRDELKDRTINYSLPDSRESVSSSRSKPVQCGEQPGELAQRLDEIGTIVALAQNQQRQGLEHHVEVALEQALEKLKEMQDLVCHEDIPSPSTCVFEARTDYQCNRTETQLILGDRIGSNLPVRIFG